MDQQLLGDAVLRRVIEPAGAVDREILIPGQRLGLRVQPAAAGYKSAVRIVDEQLAASFRNGVL